MTQFAVVCVWCVACGYTIVCVRVCSCIFYTTHSNQWFPAHAWARRMRDSDEMFDTVRGLHLDVFDTTETEKGMLWHGLLQCGEMTARCDSSFPCRGIVVLGVACAPHMCVCMMASCMNVNNMCICVCVCVIVRTVQAR